MIGEFAFVWAPYPRILISPRKPSHMPRSLPEHSAGLAAHASGIPAHRDRARVVSIHLPEDPHYEQPSPGEYCVCALRSGGDILEGYVAFWPAPFSDTIIDVCFEGAASYPPALCQHYANHSRLVSNLDPRQIHRADTDE